MPTAIKYRIISLLILATLHGVLLAQSNPSNPTPVEGNYKIVPTGGNGDFYFIGPNGTLEFVKNPFNKFSVRFWYDELGRLVAKQDARQLGEEKYSYTLYDDLNRIVESGEVVKVDGISGISNASMESQVRYGEYKNWVNSGQKQEVSFTQYDAQIAHWQTNANVLVKDFKQENLRKRVSGTFYLEGPYTGDSRAKINEGKYQFASFYSYDIHGNVKTLINENKYLEALGQSLKRVDYMYDLISGNVLKVLYQQGQKDQFYHQYTYDADNRIVDALSSSDGVIWETDAYNSGLSWMNLSMAYIILKYIDFNEVIKL
jgi:hypothetical protein